MEKSPMSARKTGVSSSFFSSKAMITLTLVTIAQSFIVGAIHISVPLDSNNTTYVNTTQEDKNHFILKYAYYEHTLSHLFHYYRSIRLGCYNSLVEGLELCAPHDELNSSLLLKHLSM